MILQPDDIKICEPEKSLNERYMSLVPRKHSCTRDQRINAYAGGLATIFNKSHVTVGQVVFCSRSLFVDVSFFSLKRV